MSELSEQIKSAFDRVPGVSVEEAQEFSRRRRVRNRSIAGLGGVTALALAVALLAVLLPGGGSSTSVKVRPAGGGSTPSASSQTPSSSASPAVTASVRLAEDTVPTGGSLSAVVTVSNSSGSSVSFTGCGDIFEVLLTSSSYRPGPAWSLCAQRLSISPGQSTYTVPVEASFSGCGTPGLPACTGSTPIPLPPGIYQARLFSQTPSVSLPAPTSVQVVAAAPACRSDEVSVSVAKQNPGNAGQPSDYIGIKNVTGQPCDIGGYPGVSTASGQGPVQTLKQGSYEIRDPGTMSIQLLPGHSVYFGIGWQNSNPPCSQLRSLQVAVTSDAQPINLTITITACAQNGSRPELDVTAIAPASAFTAGAPPP